MILKKKLGKLLLIITLAMTGITVTAQEQDSLGAENELRQKIDSCQRLIANYQKNLDSLQQTIEKMEQEGRFAQEKDALYQEVRNKELECQ